MFLNLIVLFVSSFFYEQPIHPICKTKHIDRLIENTPDSYFRRQVCSQVAFEASRRKLPVSLTVALAWSESNFIHKVTNKTSGCQGVLQVQPKYWCPKDGPCDYMEAGFLALETYLKKHKDHETALCHFKSGNTCTQVALKGARRTLNRARSLQRAAVY